MLDATKKSAPNMEPCIRRPLHLKQVYKELQKKEDLNFSYLLAKKECVSGEKMGLPSHFCKHLSWTDPRKITHCKKVKTSPKAIQKQLSTKLAVLHQFYGFKSQRTAESPCSFHWPHNSTKSICKKTQNEA